MNTSISTYKGYWWLPANPNNKIAGVLNIDSNGKVELELLGAFDYSLEAVFAGKNEKTIFGSCYAPNNFIKDISLIDCKFSVNYNFSSTFQLTSYSCRYALIGILTDSIENPDFSEADIFIKKLTRWCPPEIVTRTILDDSITLNIKTKQGVESIIDSVELEDGTSLSLLKTVNYRLGYPKIMIGQETCLNLHKEGMSAKDVIVKTNRFEQFLIFATLDYSVEHYKIILRSHKEPQDNEEEIDFLPVELITSLYRNDSSSNKSRDYLLSYADFKENFSAVLNKFYFNKEISQIWSNLISSIEKKRVFTSNDFLVVIQALDGFAIRFRKEQEFLKQLTSLRDEFMEIDKLLLSDDDLKAARGSRNYYTHILKLEKKEKEKALEGMPLLNLTKKLKVLLFCCILNFMDFNNEQINIILNKCTNSFIC